jgi:hypothetical protein
MCSLAFVAPALVPDPEYWENSMAIPLILGGKGFFFSHQHISSFTWFNSEEGIHWILVFTSANISATTMFYYVDATTPGCTMQNIEQTKLRNTLPIAGPNQMKIHLDRPVRRISKPKRRRPSPRRKRLARPCDQQILSSKSDLLVWVIPRFCPCQSNSYHHDSATLARSHFFLVLVSST